MTRAVEIAGVDAYRRGKESGWVAVRLRNGRFEGVVARLGLKDVLDELPDAQIVGVDMPIGLPIDGPRRCDEEARKFVGARRNSVFLAPPREALMAASHGVASSICKELTGKGMSQQVYGLRHKLLELEPIAERDSSLVEVHPEVSFRGMAGVEITHPKTTWNGQALRRKLLADEGIVLPDVIEAGGFVPPDDLLDAAAAAWSAARVAAGRAKSLPDGQSTGDRMTIWC